MRLIHTSDWHLGHSLHELSRRHEHLAFFDWLLDTIEEENADALLVAGDVFDTANPSAQAQSDFYEFLAGAKKRFPSLDVVIIGGNHDSAARLDAPDPLMQAFGVRVVGGVSRGANGEIDLERLIAPVKDARGNVGAWVAAVPFLRPVDLPRIDAPDVDALVEGVRRVYSRVLDEVRGKRSAGQAIVAMGHLYMTGTELSELSERKILGGNQHALPVDIFPEDVAYAALGHLHLAQKVGGRNGVRYCGSPIPLSFSETNYRHQICVVDLVGGRLFEVRDIRIPRSVELLRLPANEHGTLEALLEALGALPQRDATQPLETLPMLEARVRLDQPDPSIRAKIEEALAGKAARLVKIDCARTGTNRSLGEVTEASSLKDLKPEDVFRLKYQRDYRDEPSDALLAAFHELVDAVGQEREAA